MIENDAIDINEALYNKIMRTEKYCCKNPKLLKIITNDKDSLDRAFPAKAAITLGKCLQGLMRSRHEKELTEKTFNDAVAAVLRFDKTVASEALYFAKENTFKILMATWKHGEQIAPFVGLTKRGYDNLCAGLNQEFMLVKQKQSEYE